MDEPDKGTDHSESDQVCELATTCATVGMAVEFEGMEEVPSHTPTTEGELLLTFIVAAYPGQPYVFITTGFAQKKACFVTL